jgi:hypothetical protein
MNLNDLRDHLIAHHGYTWQTAHHPSHTEAWLQDDHRRSHEDDTAVYLDHTHPGSTGA